MVTIYSTPTILEREKNKTGSGQVKLRSYFRPSIPRPTWPPPIHHTVMAGWGARSAVCRFRHDLTRCPRRSRSSVVGTRRPAGNQHWQSADRARSGPPRPPTIASVRMVPTTSGGGLAQAASVRTALRVMGTVRHFTVARRTRFARFGQSTKGSRIRIVSSRSGEVETSATGHSISSWMRWIYLMALAGRSA